MVKVCGDFLFQRAKVEALSDTLDRTCVTDIELKKIFSELETLKTHALYPSLCGRVHNHDLNNRINRLVECARSGSDNPDLLRREIKEVREENALSPENRKLLNAAVRYIENTGFPSESQEVFQDGDTAIELCEIAALFFKGHVNAGERGLRQLGTHHQARLKEHAVALGTDASDPRVLVGFANELALGEEITSYPTSKEIELLFLEAEEYPS